MLASGRCAGHHPRRWPMHDARLDGSLIRSNAATGGRWLAAMQAERQLHAGPVCLTWSGAQPATTAGPCSTQHLATVLGVCRAWAVGAVGGSWGPVAGAVAKQQGSTAASSRVVPASLSAEQWQTVSYV
ncbi:hypothetical protein OEZ86_003476 [Tetradesmus obliquus]|nr:hypothetical protein OEZ86_003476 [Tetradesmus obliquus]